jgi:hypothetical protein
LLNIETKETDNGHAVDIVEHTEIFFRKFAYSVCDPPSFKFQTLLTDVSEDLAAFIFKGSECGLKMGIGI